MNSRISRPSTPIRVCGLVVCLSLLAVRATALQSPSPDDKSPKEPGSGIVHWTVETGG